MLGNNEYNMKNDNQIKKSWCFAFVIRCVYFPCSYKFIKEIACAIIFFIHRLFLYMEEKLAN